MSKDRPTQAQRLRQVTLAAFNYAVQVDFLEFNQLHGIPDYGFTRQGESFLSVTEIGRYMEGIKQFEPIEQSFFALLIYLGMRPGELAYLEWSFVDGDRLTIPPRNQKNRRTLVIPLAGKLK